MKKSLKTILLIIFVLALLAFAGMIIAVTTINPNKYKPQIESWLSNQTGYNLKINGKLGWEIFPTPTIHATNLVFMNPGQKNTLPVAKIGALDVRVKLMPLFTGDLRFAVGHLHFRNADFNLVRLPSGKHNWDNVGSNQPNPSNINVQNSTITWKNDQDNKDFRFTNVNFSIEPSKTHHYPVKYSFNIIRANPAIKAHFAGTATATLEFHQHYYQFSKIKMSGQLTNFRQTLQKALPLGYEGTIIINYPKQTIKTNRFKMRIGNSISQGNLNISDFDHTPHLTGSIDVLPFDMRIMLNQLGIQNLPRNPRALQLAKAKFQFNMTKDFIKLNNIAGQIDNSSFYGNFALSRFNQSLLDFDLRVNRLDLDSYLSGTPTPNKQAVLPVSYADSNAMPDLTFWKKLSGNGHILINKFYYHRLPFTNLQGSMSAKLGIIDINSLTASLYSGTMQANCNLNLRGHTPQHKMQFTINKVRLGPVLKDLTNTNKLSGRISTAFSLSGSGWFNRNLVSSLNGHGRLNIVGGRIEDINLNQLIHNKQPIVSHLLAQTKTTTNLQQLTASFGINQGIMKNDDLTIHATDFSATGAGSLNWVNLMLNYNIKANILNEPQLKHLTVPITLKGNVMDPNIQINYANIGQQLLAQQLQDIVK